MLEYQWSLVSYLIIGQVDHCIIVDHFIIVLILIIASLLIISSLYYYWSLYHCWSFNQYWSLYRGWSLHHSIIVEHYIIIDYCIIINNCIIVFQTLLSQWTWGFVTTSPSSPTTPAMTCSRTTPCLHRTKSQVRSQNKPERKHLKLRQRNPCDQARRSVIKDLIKIWDPGLNKPARGHWLPVSLLE